MPIETAIWRLDGDNPVPIGSSSLDNEKRLEDVLEKDINILGLDRLLVIGRQVPTAWGKLVDMLALGPNGDLYVIELKRGRTPREVVAQTLDYGSWAKDLDYEQISEIYAAYREGEGEDFEQAQKEVFGDQLPDDFNASHQLIIVASELDSSTERIVEYLTELQVPINVVFFKYMKDGGAEFLARSWLTSPTELEVKTPRKKRPWNGRDFYISFGEEASRRWDDARRLGFISGGGKRWHSGSLTQLQLGHRVFVHIPQRGYVATGVVVETVKPVSEFSMTVNGTEVPILSIPDLVASDMGHDTDDPDKREYLVRVEWEKAYPAEEAFWEPGLFANQNTAAKLRDAHTIKRLEEHFGLSGLEGRDAVTN